MEWNGGDAERIEMISGRRLQEKKDSLTEREWVNVSYQRLRSHDGLINLSVS